MCSFPRAFGLAGFIIGKGGRNIDQIEKASGAKLSVSDRNGPESFGKEWVYVQVSGNGGNVDRAKKLLVLNMIEATSRDGGAGVVTGVGGGGMSGGGMGGPHGRGAMGGRGGGRGFAPRGRGRGAMGRRGASARGPVQQHGGGPDHE